jgi:hypothetical protein
VSILERLGWLASLGFAVKQNDVPLGMSRELNFSDDFDVSIDDDEVQLSVGVSGLLPSDIPQNRVVGRVASGAGPYELLTAQQTADVLGSGPLDLYATGLMRVGQDASTTELVVGQTGINVDVDASILTLRGVLGIALESTGEDISIDADKGVSITSTSIAHDVTLTSSRDVVVSAPEPVAVVDLQTEQARVRVGDSSSDLALGAQGSVSIYDSEALTGDPLRVSPSGIIRSQKTADVASDALTVRGQDAHTGTGVYDGGALRISGGRPSTSSQRWGSVDIGLGQEVSLETASLALYAGTATDPQTARRLRMHGFNGGARILGDGSLTVGSTNCQTIYVGGEARQVLQSSTRLDIQSNEILMQTAGGVANAYRIAALATVTLATATGVVGTWAPGVNSAGVGHVFVSCRTNAHVDAVVAMIEFGYRRDTGNPVLLGAPVVRFKEGSNDVDNMAASTFSLTTSGANIVVEAASMPAVTKTCRCAVVLGSIS